MKLSEPVRLHGRARYARLIHQQEKWIAECKANGKSYVGPNGEAIRKADLDSLNYWREQV